MSNFESAAALVPVTLSGIFVNKRIIDDIEISVIIQEETNDQLTITKQPVQTGAAITDHAFKEPTVLRMTILQQPSLLSSFTNIFAGAGESALAQLYQQFLDLQSDRTPFTVTTLKRIYPNMLMAGLRCVTDKTTENILSLDITLQQVIFVSINTGQISASQQLNPASNQGIQNTGSHSLINTGAQGVSALFKGGG